MWDVNERKFHNNLIQILKVINKMNKIGIFSHIYVSK